MDMEKGKSLAPWAGIAVVLTVAFVLAATRVGGLESPPGNAGNARADIISIDVLKKFGDLERPAVTFLHDQHTEALKKQQKDCSTCHLTYEARTPKVGSETNELETVKRLSVKFKRLEDADRKAVMDIYHSACIDCHNEMRGKNEKSGPAACGHCHKETPDVTSSRRPIGMDRSLHYRHSKAHEKKCAACHHEYDEIAQKLYYAKDKEGTCRYCHKEETEENRMSMRLASHTACVDCHRKRLEKKLSAGPENCGGCHDPEKQEMIEKVKDVPRMERKQPDVVFVETGLNGPEEDALKNRMDPVAYDHKAHETYNDTCRVCHHAAMDSCAKCHTMTGAKEGDDIKLERAMHLTGNTKSCVGCHTDIQYSDKKCAGCHVFMGKGRMADASCLKCHAKLPEGVEFTMKTEQKEGGYLENPAAVAATKARTHVKETYGDDDVPEKVVIKDMADKYEPAEFPHRKIVQTLLKNINENKMATYFHGSKGTLCQGCHHNSPPDKKPPKCGNCHGKPFDEKHLHIPGRMAAYHQQCMGCHERMKLEKPAGCTGCHKEKK